MSNLTPFRRTPGQVQVTGSGETMMLSPDNQLRYQPFVKVIEAVDPKQLAAVYFHLYPLFQQQYRALGYPGRYFNDRLIETIDHLLATPEVQGPIRLVQPRVLYQFADPELEKLSAGQKAMIRIGPDNAARVKARLRAIRAELTRGNQSASR